MKGSDQVAVHGTNRGLRIVLRLFGAWAIGEDGAGRGPDGARPTGAGLVRALRDAVRSGRLPAGTRLPASRSLAADLGVSRGLVVRTYEQLVAEGYLVTRTGSGTTVAPMHPAPAPAEPSVDRAMVGNPGLPSLGDFPRREWGRALLAAIAETPDAELGYGDPRGHPHLRQALAEWLGRTRAVVAPVDQIIVTAGFAQGLRLVAEALVQHGIHTVAIEDPGSPGAVATLRAGGLDTRPVAVDEEGLDVAALADLGAVVVTPAHQFPTGAVLSPARRAALLTWAEGSPDPAHTRIVVEDDYDAEFRYDRAPVGALQGLAPDRVVYGGSVSKTLAPGLRLGWIVAPAWLAPTLADGKHLSDIAAPVLDQVALARFLESGAMDRHIRRTSTRYAERRRRLLACAAEQLPGWRTTGIAAGLHAVLVPPHAVTPDRLARAAAAALPLGVVPLHRFAHDPADGPSGLVVGYGAVTPDQVARGVSALAAVLRGR